MPRPTEESLRIALILKPFSTRQVEGEHARVMVRELLGRGHVVRVYGAGGRPLREAPGPSTDPLLFHHGGPRIAEFEPDVLVVYCAASPAGLTGARYARSSGVPLLLIEEGQRSGPRPVERLLRKLGFLLWGGLLRRTCKRIVTLDPVAQDELSSKAFDSAMMEIVPPGVDLGHYRPGLSSHLPARHGISGRLLLHVGAIELNCGLEKLITAFAQSVGRRGDWSLVLAGDGSAQRALRALVTRLGKGTQVHFIPKPREEELPGLLGSSTLFASPREDEGSGSLIERRALACGLPVLASERPGLRHLVEDDGCGRVAAGGTLEAWQEMISSASSSPERRRRWGERAREVAEERFAWPQIVDHLAGILTDMTRESRVLALSHEAVAEPKPEQS